MTFAPSFIPAIDLNSCPTPKCHEMSCEIEWFTNTGISAVSSERDRIRLTHKFLVIHSLIKAAWDSKHRIPLSNKGKKAYAPLGKLYKRIEALAAKLHASGVGNEFKNAGEWTLFLLAEGAIEGIEAWGDCGGKKKRIESLQGKRKKLSSFENPFTLTAEPHTYQFFEYAIAEVEQSDVIRKEYYWPLLKALSEWIAMYRSPYWLDGRWKPNSDQLLLKVGKGGRSYRPIKK